MTQKWTSNWLGPGLLLLLGMLNIIFGALQIGTIYQGQEASEMTNSIYHEQPLPIVLHILAGTFLNLLGPLQLVPSFRKQFPAWHKWVGYSLLISGICVGFTGLYMNHFFPQYGGLLKYSGIATYCIGILLALYLAIRAILKRNIQEHRAWMLRVIAIGLAPATQRVCILPIFFALGDVSDLLIGLVIWGALIVNLGVVEWVLHKDRRKRASSASSYFQKTATT